MAAGTEGQAMTDVNDGTLRTQRPAWMQDEGVITLDHLCKALNLSDSTVLGLGIPHIKLARGTHLYFIDEVITWLRAQERTR